MADSNKPPVNAAAHVTLQNGSVCEGRVYTIEPTTSFCSGGLTILRKPGEAGHSSFSILVGESLEKLMVQDSDLEEPVFEIRTAPSKVTAATRESDTASNFHVDKQNIGAAVTKVAQTLYNKFCKQFPKDTKWHKPGDTQDIVVLGVRVNFPFSADNCEVEIPEGSKSLERIRNMVTNFLNSESTLGAV